MLLSRRHIYILPTGYGVFYAAVLLAMLAGAINYTLSLGFVLTFLLASIGVVAMLHTWRNLAGLHISNRRTPPIFAGEDAVFELTLQDTQGRARYAIAAQLQHEPPAYIDVPVGGNALVKLSMASSKRGWLTPGRLTFFCDFPLGIFRAWSYAALDCRCLVYPRPAAPGSIVPASVSQGASGIAQQQSGDEDFAGHRNYQLGDSPRRVDWKASSREQGLLTKVFQGEAQTSLWLDWTLTPGRNAEQRLSQLTRWVIDAEAAQQSYGLRLPGLEYAPARGEAHYRQCLMALALLDAGT